MSKEKPLTRAEYLARRLGQVTVPRSEMVSTIKAMLERKVPLVPSERQRGRRYLLTESKDTVL